MVGVLWGGVRVGEVFIFGSVGIWKIENVIIGSFVVGWGGWRKGLGEVCGRVFIMLSLFNKYLLVS